MSDQALTIEWREAETVTPYEKNAKKHPKKQLEQIAESIRAFGFNQPIVIDTKGVIIVGHGRFEAATDKLGWKKVPCVTLNLTEEQAKSYRLADNKLNESDWDMEMVIAELKELSVPMLDLTGFSRDLVLEDDEKDDVVPGAPEKPRSKAGDVYILRGGHRVVCGDSTQKRTYRRLSDDIQADMVFTDPPYNVNYAGRGKKTSKGIENDHMDKSAFLAFLTDFFSYASLHVKTGAGWYIFHSSSSQDQFKEALESAGLEVRAQLIWNKPTASMGWGDYRWKHEPFFYAGKKEQKITFYGDRTHKTVVDFQDDEKKLVRWAKRQKRLEKMGLMTVWTMKRDRVDEYEHPTQKPVELVLYAIVNSSKGGDVVLDPFLGSGTTLIAAEKSERKCFGIEMDPSYVDVCIQRWVDFTGVTEVEKNGEIETWKPSR